MEFFADASSLLMAIYEVLNILFYFIYNFAAYYYFSETIFFFKELDNGSHFKIFSKIKQIHNLVYITDLSEKHSEINLSDVKSKDSKPIKNSRIKIDEFTNIEKIKYEEENKKEINIYNNQRKTLDIKHIKYSSYSKENGIKNKKNYFKDSNYLIQLGDNSNNKFDKKFHKYSMNIKNIKKNKEDISKIKNSERDKIYLDESV